MKTGNPISPPGGYKGGGMQLLVDASIDPAGDVWVSNNWQDPASRYGKPDEGVSTRCGGKASSFSTAWPSRCVRRKVPSSRRRARSWKSRHGRYCPGGNQPDRRQAFVRSMVSEPVLVVAATLSPLFDNLRLAR
jgi:hypothetical protein